MSVLSWFITTAVASDVVTHVVDIGAGLCTITEAPGPNGPVYMVYDAGSTFPFDRGLCFDAVRERVDGSVIDLMIISHSDADHLGDADHILDAFEVRRVVRTGDVRETQQWNEFNRAVDDEVRDDGIIVMDLFHNPLHPGFKIPLGDAEVMLVAGWHRWRGDQRFDGGEERNVISIVARLSYEGRSILFSGDTIGRRKNDNPDACKNAEEFMAVNSALVPLRSNVLLAPHHGGANGSSACFIEAVFGSEENRVVPRFVVFPAGHSHGHPDAGTVDRLARFGGVGVDFMFRTDRGDDEAKASHWDDPNGTPGCKDKPGDDTIEIVLPKQGVMRVAYTSDDAPCDGVP